MTRILDFIRSALGNGQTFKQGGDMTQFMSSELPSLWLSLEGLKAMEQEGA